jgi:hypothetical protein
MQRGSHHNNDAVFTSIIASDVYRHTHSDVGECIFCDDILSI